ncbi:MAG: glycosyltransferase family 2 protein, partial [Bacteroidales bacterium]
MLSILIPVYNRDVRELVISLNKQANELGVPYEIICIDDCSTRYKEENREIKKIDNCLLTELDANAGRSEIRNRLIESAKYPYLLFLDCDMLPVKSDFISMYWENRDNDVVCGGILYRKSDCTKCTRLHYHYGIRREVYDFEKRKEYAFLSGNFFIKKEVLETVSFNNLIAGYGHEDTYFGLMLKKRGYKLCFINNPAYHTGLNESGVFLANTRSAINNLFHEDKDLEKDLQENVRLSDFGLKHPTLLRIAGKGYRLNKVWIEKVLPVVPSVYLLDFYKLSY